jgi:putative transcriptional regulator
MAMPIFAYSKVKPLRQAKGLNQAEIAAELGVSRPTYVLIEQGEKEPTLSQLYTLSRLLGVEAGELCANLPSTVADTSDYEKFKDLVFVCASQGSDGEAITKTKLSILTYLVDFVWYRLNSRPMTGAAYRCMERGPVADDYFRAIDDLYEAQAIALEPRGTSMLIRTVEQRPSKSLSEKELLLVRDICKKWQKVSTETAVSFARSQVPCRSAKQGDPIAYEAILSESVTNLY